MQTQDMIDLLDETEAPEPQEVPEALEIVSETVIQGQVGKDSKSRPTKSLPTPRIKFVKQLDILRAWVAASNGGTKAASNIDVQKVTSLSADTISMANPFFAEIGLLVRNDGGYVPSAEVVSFNRAYEWKPETAAERLAPAFERSWIMEVLGPRLGFRSLSEEEALQVLGEAANAGPDLRPRVKLILDYLEEVALIRREGGEIRKVKNTPPPTGDTQLQQGSMSSEQSKQPTVEPARSEPLSIPPAALLGGVEFQISLKINMAEFATWEAERIAAFFNGIARVLAAKANVDGGR